MNEELNDNKIFEFDVEKYKKQMRKGYIWLMIEIPFFMGIAYFLIHKLFFKPFDLLSLLGLSELSGLIEYMLIPIFIFFTIVLEIISFYFLKRNPFAPKKMTLEFLEDRLLVNRDKTKEEIIYSDIIKYKVYKTKENEIKCIDLITNKSIIRIWQFIKMDELYLQLKGKFENEQGQEVRTFIKLIPQKVKGNIIIALLVIIIFFVFRYYKFNVILLNIIVWSYIGLTLVFFKEVSVRSLEYKSSPLWYPTLFKYMGITFLILSLGFLIIGILETMF